MKNKGIMLERVLLHNWYRYHAQIIHFGKINLITGETGAGKSVINDAILYALTSSISFNKASGNENKGNRTLFGYIRGETGNGLLRPDGCVTAYIFLEYRNPITNRRYLVGVSIESRNSINTQTHTNRYVIYDEEKDICLEDLDYMDGDTEKFCNDVAVKIGSRYENLKKYKTQNRDAFKEDLTRLFGENFHFLKFQDLFKKAIAYKPEKKLENSLKEQLFGERLIEVGGCLDLMEGITHFEEIIANNQKKLDLLSPIANAIDEYNDLQEKARISEIAKIAAEFQYMEEDIKKKKEEMEELLHSIQTEEQKKQTIIKKQKDIDILISSLQSALDSLDAQYGTEKIQKMMEEKKTELQSEEKNAKNLDFYFDDLKSVIGMDHFLDDAIERFKESSHKEEQVDTAFYHLQNQMLQKKKELDIQLMNTKMEISQIQKRKEELKAEFAVIKNQNTAAGKKTALFIEELHSKAKKERRTINPVILADMITSVDTDWQPWIEAVLGREREIILCDPKDYSFIKEAMAQSYNKEIRLLDYNAIRTKANCREGSLAEKIKTTHMIARDFLNFKLGHIMIASKENLEKYPNSISIEGLRYNGYSLYSLGKPVFCLGRKTLETRKRKLQDNIRYAAGSLMEKEKMEKELISIEKTLSHCIIQRKETAEGMIYSYARQDRILTEIRELEKNLVKLQQDPTYITLMVQMGEQKEEKENLVRQQEEVSFKIRFAKNEVNHIQADENTEGSLAFLQKKAEEKQEVFLSYSEDDQNAARELLKSKDRRSLANRSIQWDRYKNEAYRLEMHLEGIIAKFIGKYPEEDHGSDVSAFSYYTKRKQALYAENAIEIANKIQEYKNRFKNNFKANLISKLYGNILWAKKFAKELNQTLENIRFGNDKYKVCVKNTKDEEKKAFLNVITRIGKDFEKNGDLGELDFKKREMTDEFCEMLLGSMKDTDKDRRDRLLSEYLDYRNYLEFDVEKNDGISLKDKLGSDSGGEAQTAYYVIIAAAFSNIYDHDSIQLVMIDEAFDKIDDNRKGQMLHFFKSFGFQCIITTPTIAPFVSQADTVISVIKTKHYTIAVSKKTNEENQEIFFCQKKEA